MNRELERLLELFEYRVVIADLGKKREVEYQQLKDKIEKALEFWGCPDLNERVKQNEKIVDEIRKIIKKESKWFEEIADKTFTPYFDYRVIIDQLQSILEGEK